MQLSKFLILPKEITPFERTYVAKLNKVALVFFYLHIPVFVLLALSTGRSPLSAVALSVFVVLGPTIAYRMLQNPRHISVVCGITAMLMGGLLVHFGQGPVQIEMHFYFFALLAMLCTFANPMVNIAAAITVALHHLIVWLIVPNSVFNYDAQWWVVLVHAGFVVLETIACCFISRSFFDNVIGLEKIVETRTETLREKQRDMSLILDNVDNGLITIDMAGRMSSECSRALKQWFGEPVADKKLSAWLGQYDHNFGDWLHLGLETLAEGVLPAEVAMAQLPRVLRVGEKTYSVQYQLIDGEKILVVIANITERLRGEAADNYQAELVQMFQQIMGDKEGFIEFLAEADEIIATLRTGSVQDREQLLRLLHTLKGNAGVFGLKLIAERCDDLETHVAEEGVVPGERELAVLFQAWDKVRADISRLLGESRQGGLEVEEADYQAFSQAISGGSGPEALQRMVESWRLEPTAKRLARVEQQLWAIAERLGRKNVAVSIESNGLRVDPAGFGPFWYAFIHVLRNAVDHGTQPIDVRRALGKPDQCLIKVSTTLEGNAFVVTIEDDGPGIDWEALRAKAESLSKSVAEGEQVIYQPGVSSRATINEISGRGVGMGAALDACQALGGKVEISAGRSGQGTRFRFVFPGARAYEGHTAILSRGNPNNPTSV
jgi:two-component system chemotaxis sensor kinase CheA